jgi:hypothetical protein
MSNEPNLTRKEGWRQWVDAPPRQRPERLARSQLAALSTAAKQEYDDSRFEWHANFGTIKTPQLQAIHEQLRLIVTTNRHGPDRVKGAAVIDALSGLGKSTIVNAFAREFDREQRQRYGETTEDGHERIPVFRVELSSRTTLRSLNQMICDFYAHPGLKRATATSLGAFAADSVRSCGTRIGIVDELHFMNVKRADGIEVSNHLKSLANLLGITFIFAGVGLVDRGIFSEGLDTKHRIFAQTARRATRLALPPFTIEDDDGKEAWRNLLKATEQQVVLAEHRPGDLTKMSDYLFARTTGHIGSCMTLISRGCTQAIFDGVERLTEELLDRFRIDEAAEDERTGLQENFAAGKLTTRTRKKSSRS